MFRVAFQKYAAAKDRRIINALSMSVEERYLDFLKTYPLLRSTCLSECSLVPRRLARNAESSPEASVAEVTGELISTRRPTASWERG